MNKEEIVKEIVKYYPTYYDVVERLLFIQQENKQYQSDIEKLMYENENLERHNKQLKYKIKNAKEYIKDRLVEFSFSGKELPHWEFDDTNIVELIEILKGDSNEN